MTNDNHTTFEKTTMADSGLVESNTPLSDAKAKLSEAVQNKLDTGKAGKKRGRKSEAEKEAIRQQLKSESVDIIAAMMSPKQMETVVKAPANILLATTGNKIWDLPKDETSAMAASASQVAQNFVATADPKWVSLIMFAVSIFGCYGTRGLTYLAEKKREPEF